MTPKPDLYRVAKATNVAFVTEKTTNVGFVAKTTNVAFVAEKTTNINFDVEDTFLIQPPGSIILRIP